MGPSTANTREARFPGSEQPAATGGLPFTLDDPATVEKVLRGERAWPTGRTKLHFRPGSLQGMSNAETFDRCYTDPKVGPIPPPAHALRFCSLLALPTTARC